mmetsp:Transcript_20126/g.42132  ORF Transcript_20126/g.42132 Transcript_20126/m.42132 type:complete len:255 (+) Transcript_20126:287-1051(+)
MTESSSLPFASSAMLPCFLFSLVSRADSNSRFLLSLSTIGEVPLVELSESESAGLMEELLVSSVSEAVIATVSSESANTAVGLSMSISVALVGAAATSSLGLGASLAFLSSLEASLKTPTATEQEEVEESTIVMMEQTKSKSHQKNRNQVIATESKRQNPKLCAPMKEERMIEKKRKKLILVGVFVIIVACSFVTIFPVGIMCVPRFVRLLHTSNQPDPSSLHVLQIDDPPAMLAPLMSCAFHDESSPLLLLDV